MVKYCCNNFHALKITFANETARLCDALGVDPFEVMDLVCQDTQLNISPAYLKPGFAFGGSCLPKDLRATSLLGEDARRRAADARGILQSNREHMNMALDKVMATGKRRIGLIGLSFKTGTDDLRESPLVTLAEQLIGKGMQLARLRPRSPPVAAARCQSPLHRAHLPHIGKLLRAEIADVIKESEVLVVGLSGPRNTSRTGAVLSARPGRSRSGPPRLTAARFGLKCKGCAGERLRQTARRPRRTEGSRP